VPFAVLVERLRSDGDAVECLLGTHHAADIEEARARLVIIIGERTGEAPRVGLGDDPAETDNANRSIPTDRLLPTPSFGTPHLAQTQC
jgi:hypothetical protein